ncbi:MAG: acylneuraminate cytidylyltransferase family protein [Candidatus Wallbacteria bacterium]
MYNFKKILALIPARGGSKGLPGKNIIDLCGKPLIAWTISEAHKSKYIDKTILSSEDNAIINVAIKYGCEVPFIRPAELSADDVSGMAPVLHSIEKFPGYDYIVLLQPTSPLRNCEDIDKCIELCINNKMNSCVSVSEPDHSPYWMYSINSESKLVPLFEKESEISRRQDLPEAYMLNGAVYVAKINWFLKTKTFFDKNTMAYIMQRERSVDIDNKIDLELAKIIISEKIKNRDII